MLSTSCNPLYNTCLPHEDLTHLPPSEQISEMSHSKRQDVVVMLTREIFASFSQRSPSYTPFRGLRLPSTRRFAFPFCRSSVRSFVHSFDEMKCRVLNLRSRVALRRWRCVHPRRIPRPVRCEIDTAVATPLVKVTFTIPHHVEFGQSVCVLGSSEALGDWQVEKSACLSWNEGDVWSGIVEMPAAPVEYKYFTKNADGTAAEWQPSPNLTVDVEGEDMEVHDEWNGMLQAMTTEQEMMPLVGEAPEEPKPIEAEAATVSAFVHGPIPETIQNLAEEVVKDAPPAKEKVIAHNASGVEKEETLSA